MPYKATFTYIEEPVDRLKIRGNIDGVVFSAHEHKLFPGKHRQPLPQEYWVETKMDSRLKRNLCNQEQVL